MTVDLSPATGAAVINLSLGGYSDSATLRAAIATASQTVVVVGYNSFIAGQQSYLKVFLPVVLKNR